MGALWLALVFSTLYHRQPATLVAVEMPTATQALGMAVGTAGLYFLGWSVKSLGLRRLFTAQTVYRLHGNSAQPNEAGSLKEQAY